MDKRLILLVMLLASAVAAGAQTERRIYTKAEQESAQKREVENVSSDTGLYPVGGSLYSLGAIGLCTGSKQAVLQTGRNGLCHFQHEFCLPVGRQGRHTDSAFLWWRPERCRGNNA